MRTIEEVWEAVSQIMKNDPDISGVAYDMWLGDITPVAI